MKQVKMDNMEVPEMYITGSKMLAKLIHEIPLSNILVNVSLLSHSKQLTFFMLV